MSLPALCAIRERYPGAHIAVLAKPWVADLYRRESFANEVIPYDRSRWELARALRRRKFDCAILLQNAFDAALIAWLARIPVRIGYNRDGRGLLLTRAVEVPGRDEVPRHQRFYYLELLRRAGILDTLPPSEAIHLAGPGVRHVRRIVGVSPGAAYGTAKQWLPERFAEAAARLAEERGAEVALFGSSSERDLCEQVAGLLNGHKVTNHAGRTTLSEFIDLASQCKVFLTNDSGAMHIASALGVPTIAIFGATDHVATGPTGPLARVIREPVDCSPCLLRECPIDHRCMTRVTVERVVAETRRILPLDTRSKIISAAQAQDLAREKPANWFTGHFDPLLAEHAALLHQTTSVGHVLIVEVTNPPHPLLAQRARAELVAALADVDYVVIADREDSAPDMEITRRFVQSVRDRSNGAKA